MKKLLLMTSGDIISICAKTGVKLLEDFENEGAVYSRMVSPGW